MKSAKVVLAAYQQSSMVQRTYDHTSDREVMCFVLLAAAVITPKFGPDQYGSCADHCAGQIISRCQPAPGSGSATARTPDREAGHRGSLDYDVTRLDLPAWTTKNLNQPVSGLFSCSAWARLIAAARTVHFTCRDAGNPNFGAFSTPDGPVAIINMGRSALELVVCRNDGCGGC